MFTIADAVREFTAAEPPSSQPWWQQAPPSRWRPVWFRRGLFLIVSPELRAILARRQTETLLIALCKFPGPPLAGPAPLSPADRGPRSGWIRRQTREADLRGGLNFCYDLQIRSGVTQRWPSGQQAPRLIVSPNDTW